MAAYCCSLMREAEAMGELARDSYGRWKWPLNYEMRHRTEAPPRGNWPFCPFCGSDLPRAAVPGAGASEPPYEISPDATSGDDGGEGRE